MPPETQASSQTWKEATRAARRALVKERREKAAAERRLALLEELCRRVAQGQSLMTVCTEDRAMPHYDTALRWLHDDPLFADMYKNAQRARADVLFEETLQIADDARNDWMLRNDPNNPGWLANGEHLARSRLRVDTRKWAASKLNPHRYGDKLELGGDPTKPVVVSVTHRIVHVTPQAETGPVVEHKASNDWDDP